MQCNLPIMHFRYEDIINLVSKDILQRYTNEIDIHLLKFSSNIANPSMQKRKIYYQLPVNMSQLNCSIFLIWSNKYTICVTIKHYCTHLHSMTHDILREWNSSYNYLGAYNRTWEYSEIIMDNSFIFGYIIWKLR